MEQLCIEQSQLFRLLAGKHPADLLGFVQRVVFHGCFGPDVRQDEIFNALWKVR